MKTMQKIISSTAALGIIAAVSCSGCFAADNGTTAVLVNNVLTNSVVDGGPHIDTITNINNDNIIISNYTDDILVGVTGIDNSPFTNVIGNGVIDINVFTPNPYFNTKYEAIDPYTGVIGFPSEYDNSDVNMNIFNNILKTLQSNIDPDTSTAENNTPETSDIDTDIASQILSLVNKERAAIGLNNLTLDTTLNKMAQYKAEDMASNGFSHDGSYGSFSDLINMFHINGTAFGENIAMGQKTAESVMNSWMSSQVHRENILDKEYTKLGVGCYQSNDTIYWVQEFSN